MKLLIAILLNCPLDAEQHAVTGFWHTWSNPLYQLRLLDALLSLPGDTFNFVGLPGRRIVTIDDIPQGSPTIKQLAANVQGHTWNSLDLFEVLVRLASSDSPDVLNFIREMLDKAVKLSAEIVHMGLLQVAVSSIILQRLCSLTLVIEFAMERYPIGLLSPFACHVPRRPTQSSTCFHAHLANTISVSAGCIP